MATQNAAVERASGEIVAFSDANSSWDRDALSELVAALRGPRRRLRLRTGLVHRPRGRQRGGRLLAARDARPRARVRARRRHRRQRRDLRGPPRRLPLPGAVAQPRPLAALRAAQGGLALRLRPRGAGRGADGADDRGRVRPQAPDDGRHPRHRRRRPDVGPAGLRAAVRLRDPLPPGAPLREPAPARGRCSSPTCGCSPPAGSTAWRSPSSSGCSPWPPARS